MKSLSLILVFLMTGCSTTRAPSLNMLDRRADYESEQHLEKELGSVNQPLLVPNRTEPQVTDIWIHPHEMPTGDYFRGGWIRTVVKNAQWIMKEENKPLLVKKKPKRAKRKSR